MTLYEHQVRYSKPWGPECLFFSKRMSFILVILTHLDSPGALIHDCVNRTKDVM